MAASRRKKKQRKEKFEKALTAVLCGIVAVLVLLAAVISLSEENGGALPTWQQLYLSLIHLYVRNIAVVFRQPLDDGKGDFILVLRRHCLHQLLFV